VKLLLRVLREASGACGDLGLFLSLTLALHFACGLSFVASLAWAGLANIITGIVFPIPLPVQPMKAIAAIAIAGGMTAAEITGAGLLTGLLVLALSFTGGFDRLYRLVPTVLIRALQLGLGLQLAWIALLWMADAFDPNASATLGGLPSIVTLFAALIMAAFAQKVPAGFLVFSLGLIVAWVAPRGEAAAALPLFASAFTLDSSGWLQALGMSIAQAPLTILNSVLAIVLLSRDLFPDLPKKTITATKMGWSVGLFNVVGGSLGVMPVCHGSGGLAAQYRFGARTRWSIIGLGLGKVFAAVAFGTAALPLLAVYPEYILGVLLLFAAFELARHGIKIPTAEIPVLIFTASAIFFLGSLYGLLAGTVLYGLLAILLKWPPDDSDT